MLPGGARRLVSEPAQRRGEACCNPVRGLFVPQVRILFWPAAAADDDDDVIVVSVHVPGTTVNPVSSGGLPVVVWIHGGG